MITAARATDGISERRTREDIAAVAEAVTQEFCECQTGVQNGGTERHAAFRPQMKIKRD